MTPFFDRLQCDLIPLERAVELATQGRLSKLQ
jgi:hypothetical protein